jgi:glycerol uptake facilitator-like aquaporin
MNPDRDFGPRVAHAILPISDIVGGVGAAIYQASTVTA